VLVLVMRVSTVGFRAVVERIQRRCEIIDADHFEEYECFSPVSCMVQVKTEDEAPIQMEGRMKHCFGLRETHYAPSSSRRVSRRFYAVQRGRVLDIYTNWKDCQAQTDRFKGYVFKSFSILCEA
jgi:hypothetical protein